MKGPVNLLARVSALLVLAGLAVSVISTAPWGAANAVAQDKKDKDKDKGKDKDKDKDKDKKKEIPKDKTPPALVLKGHKDWINYAGFSPDGKYLITASRDKTVKIWDLKDGKDIATLKDHPTEVRFALFLPGGKEVITTTGDWIKPKKDDKGKKNDKDKKDKKEEVKFEGQIRVWSVPDGKLLRSFKGHSSFIRCAALSDDGKLLATGSDDGTAIVWNVKEGKAVQTLKGFPSAIQSVTFTKDATRLATGFALPIPKDPKKAPKPGEEVLVKVWNIADGKEVQALKGPERDVSSLAFSPDGKYLATGSWDGKIYLFDKDGKVARKLEAQEGVLSIDFTSDGKYLAASGWEDTTKVWEVESGKELLYRNGHARSVTTVLFSPDNARFVTAGTDQTIKVWEMPKQK